jgi:hypothetical protein
VKLNFGIAVASNRQLAELPAVGKINFLELPSVSRIQPDFILPQQWKRRFMRVSCRAETRTLGALIDAGYSMTREFYRVFSAGCTEFAKLGAKEISLGIDWESVFDNEKFSASVSDILRCCYGIIYRNRLTPLIELRLPGVAAGQVEKFLRFRNRLLIPARTLVDLHPHEPGALELMEKFSAVLPFEVSRIRVSFDASEGNYLSPKLLERIKACIRPVGKEIPELCFYPGRSADKSAFAALSAVLS